MRKITVAQKQAIYAKPVDAQYRPAYYDEQSGGTVHIHELVDTSKPDFKDVLAEAIAFAKTGRAIKLPPEIHVSEKEARNRLLPGYSRERSNPDLDVEGIYWEVERAEGTERRNVKERIKSGLEQADNIILLLRDKTYEAYAREYLAARAQSFIIK